MYQTNARDIIRALDIRERRLRLTGCAKLAETSRLLDAANTDTLDVNDAIASALGHASTLYQSVQKLLDTLTDYLSNDRTSDADNTSLFIRVGHGHGRYLYLFRNGIAEYFDCGIRTYNLPYSAIIGHIARYPHQTANAISKLQRTYI